MRSDQLTYDARVNDFVPYVPEDLHTPEGDAWFQIHHAYMTGSIDTLEEAEEKFNKWTEVAQAAGIIGVKHGR